MWFLNKKFRTDRISNKKKLTKKSVLKVINLQIESIIFFDFSF